MQKTFTKILKAIEASHLSEEDKVLCRRRIRRRKIQATLPSDCIWTITQRKLSSDEVLDTWVCDDGNGGAQINELCRVLCAEENDEEVRSKVDGKIARVLYDVFEASDWDEFCREDSGIYAAYLRALAEGNDLAIKIQDSDRRENVPFGKDDYGKIEKCV